MSSKDSKDKFYFSFYKLNNGKIINLNVDQCSGRIQYNFYYTKKKLKTGEIRDYKFGNAKAIDANEMSKEFFEWFDNLPTVKDLIDNFDPNIDEEKCVKDFYLKNIETKKDIQTDTIEVNNKMKRYLQLFSGLICILIGICFLALQNGVYLTTWYAVMASIFIPIGLLILGNLEKKNFFSRTSFFFNKIYGWRNRKYEGIFLYITFIIISLLFVGLILLVGNIIQ